MGLGAGRGGKQVAVWAPQGCAKPRGAGSARTFTFATFLGAAAFFATFATLAIWLQFAWREGVRFSFEVCCESKGARVLGRRLARLRPR